MKKINRIVLIGMGSIGQAVLPLLAKNFKAEIIIFDKELSNEKRLIAETYNSIATEKNITIDNYHSTLKPLLNNETILLNLAVSVSTEDLIKLSQQYGANYLDTCIEPWTYETSTTGHKTNYELRETIKKIQTTSSGMSTALVAHGANPGFISILMKKAITQMALANNIERTPKSSTEWAALANELGIEVVQISERDTQVSHKPTLPGEFVSTWSVDGFITECLQPAELGWGTHEITAPENSTLHDYSITLRENGSQVKVKSWSPNYLTFDGYLLTHNESLSIAEYLTLKKNKKNLYRPTVFYAYHPCDATVACMHMLPDQKNITSIKSKRILKEDISAGIDELGVFLISRKYRSLWLGSNLSIGKSKKTFPLNSATSLQVVSSILAGISWIEHNPNSGIVESENIDWVFTYDACSHYWSPIVSEEVDWAPDDINGPLTFSRFLVK